MQCASGIPTGGWITGRAMVRAMGMGVSFRSFLYDILDSCRVVSANILAQ